MCGRLRLELAAADVTSGTRAVDQVDTAAPWAAGPAHIENSAAIAHAMAASMRSSSSAIEHELVDGGEFP